MEMKKGVSKVDKHRSLLFDQEELEIIRELLSGEAKNLAVQEEKLLVFIRGLKYGEVTIKVQDGLPVLIERAREKIKL